MTRLRKTRIRILVATAVAACALLAAPAALGLTWFSETSPTTGTLYGVACPDASHCFAVGGTTSAGKIIHTSNGAVSSPTWTTQTPPSNATAQYNDVNCANDNDCVAVGNVPHTAPLISGTTNGGSTWTAQTPPGTATAALQGVSCPSASDCIAVGGLVGSSPTIIQTTNGGSTWTSRTPPSGVNTPLNYVACPSTSVCFAVGGSGSIATVIATTNGGSTWTAQTLPATDDVALNSIACPSTTTCFAVGNAISGTGEIVGTTNGGTNWSYQSDGTSQTLYDVSCWDVNDCVAVGVSGRAVWTTNGSGWSWLNSPTSNTLYGVDVSNQSAGAAVGASGTILGYSLGCNSGGLNFTPPTSLAWPSTALTGRDQSITTPLSLSPDDESGSGAGWNLTATSTTFSSGTHALPTSAAQITAASDTAGTGQCSAPANQISYPVTVPAATTAPAAVKVYDASSGSGAGPANVTLTAILAVPGNARAGTYTSTWTLTLSSGP